MNKNTWSKECSWCNHDNDIEDVLNNQCVTCFSSQNKNLEDFW
jgi:hypothetical protein